MLRTACFLKLANLKEAIEPILKGGLSIVSTDAKQNLRFLYGRASQVEPSLQGCRTRSCCRAAIHVRAFSTPGKNQLQPPRAWNTIRQYRGGALTRRWRQLTPQIPEQAALYGLIAANVAVFFAWRGNSRFMMRHFTTSWDAVKAGKVHTVILSAFSQRDTWHLVSNMIGLYFFGRNVAWVLGGRGLVLLYLAGGSIGSLVYITGQAVQAQKLSRQGGSPWFASAESYFTAHAPSLGSSGAVNSIVIFEILMVPTATVLIYGILPVPAWVLGGLFLFQDVSGAFGHGQSNIGYTAHLGGAAVGALAYFGVRRGRIPTQWRRWR